MSIICFLVRSFVHTLFVGTIVVSGSAITNSDISAMGMGMGMEMREVSARQQYSYGYKPPQNEVVYVSKGELCGSESVSCDKRLTCIGNGASAKCYSVAGHGGHCDYGAYMICASGTACRSPASGTGPNKCAAPRVKGNGCDGGYHYCGAGLTCAQYGDHKRCVMLMKENGDCSKTFMLCDKGLVCTHFNGYRRCEPPRAAKGEYCSASKKCARGLTCVGTGASAKCIKVVGYGHVCSGTYVACESKLTCRAPAYGTGPKKCVSPRIKGNRCDGGYHFCPSSLHCLKWDHITRCVSLADLNADCSPSFTLCKGEAVCSGKPGYRKCVSPPKVVDYTPPPAPKY